MSKNEWGKYSLAHAGFEIVIKQDFGGSFFLIDGLPCAWGYVVCYGRGHQYAGCNAMPGAVWFQTVKDAKTAINDLITAEENPSVFWYLRETRGAA